MTQYVLLIPDDYDAWERLTAQERADVYSTHNTFAERLSAGGHQILGGGELKHPREARTVRRSSDGTAGVVVTDGPYAESVEQLSGYYLVESHDLADLEQCCGILAQLSGVEIRECGPAVDDGPPDQSERAERTEVSP